MRIAVTGATGFIGTEVVRLALERGFEVVAVDFWQDAIRTYTEARHPILDDVFRNLSGAAAVVDPEDFVADLGRHSPQLVVHAGAIVDTENPGKPDLFDRNVRYVEDLARAADRVGSHIVFCSSAAVYGAAPRKHPINAYALTKAMGERIIQNTKVRTASLRLFNVFGRNEHHKGRMASMPFKLVQAYLRGERLNMHSPDAKRDFVPVSTVARVILDRAAEMLGPKLPIFPNHATFDVGTGKPTSFRDLDSFVRQAVGAPFSVVNEIPMPGHLEGRYQGFTCAGAHGSKHLMVLGGDVDTRTGLEETYGQR